MIKCFRFLDTDDIEIITSHSLTKSLLSNSTDTVDVSSGYFHGEVHKFYKVGITLRQEESSQFKYSVVFILLVPSLRSGWRIISIYDNPCCQYEEERNLFPSGLYSKIRWIILETEREKLSESIFLRCIKGKEEYVFEESKHS